MKVKDLHIYDEYSAAESDVSLKDGVNVMIKEKTYFLIVVEEGKPVGLIGLDELMEAVAAGKRPEETLVRDVMSRVKTISVDSELEDAIEFIESKETALPVVEDTKLVGLATLPDIISGLRRLTRP